MWEESYGGPLCLSCPDWLAPLDDSILDLRLEGFIRTDVDFSTFAGFADELGLDPSPRPQVPNGVELSFGGVDTFTSSADGVELGTGIDLVGIHP